MKKLKAVKIIHDIFHRLDFLFLAEFFRFMGIFVGEDTILEFDPQNINNCKCFDAFIYIGYKNHKNNSNLAKVQVYASEEEIAEAVKRLPVKTIYMGDCLKEILNNDEMPEVNGFPQPAFMLNNTDASKLLMKCLISVYNSLEEDSTDDEEVINSKISSQFLFLVNLYVDNQVWKHSVNLQFFPKRKSQPIKEAKDAFLKVYKELDRYLRESPIDETKQYYFYALLWCATRVNSASDFLQEILYFPIQDLSEKCRNLCLEFPDFANAKVLLGLCYENSSVNALEAVSAFRDALNSMNEECYTTAIYYWIGKRYESYEVGKMEAEENYRKAYQLRPKFRNIFKVAVCTRDSGDYEEATGKFDEIISKLQSVLSLDFCDPLELEYAFKTYSQKCYINYKYIKDYPGAIENGEKAVEIDRRIDRSKFYDMFYQNDATVYRNLSKSRMELKNIYRILASAYSKILEVKKSKEYWKKIEEIEK